MAKNQENTRLKNKAKKGTRGITLIALVVTIIVLLLLAGISISMLTGNNSILNRAGEAKDETEKGQEKEIVELSAVQAMGKNKRGNIEEEELQNILDKNAGEGKTKVEIIRKKMIVTFENSKRSYKVYENGDVEEYTKIDIATLPIMDNTTFKNTISEQKENIFSVKVVDKIDIPDGAESYDISKNKDNSVKMWLVSNADNEGMYDLCIGSEGGVKPNSCNRMFYEFSNCESIDLEKLYTEDVTDMGEMFCQCVNLKDLDISYLNVEKVISPPTFRGCKYLKSIDMSNFNVMAGSLAFDGCSNLEELKLGKKIKVCPENMKWTFRGCGKLKYIDTTKLDTSNVKQMGSLFQGCASLESLDVSNWDTSNVVSMYYPGTMGVFTDCKKLKNIDLRNWNTSKVTTMAYMFSGCSELTTIYVGDGWDVSNVTNSNRMFNQCYKLVGDITYDETITDITYATKTGGYMTYKSN